MDLVGYAIARSAAHGVFVGLVAAVVLALAPNRPRVRHAIAMLGLVALPASLALAVARGLPMPDPVLLAATGIVQVGTAPAWPRFVGGLWLMGLTFMATRLLFGWLGARRLRRRATPPPADLLERVRRLADALGLGLVPVGIADVLDGPQVVGLLRPVVLVPTATLLRLSPDQLDAVLAHELAHLVHLDPLAHAAQEAIVALFFFHPVAWWLRHVARREREAACDDVARALVGKKALATALVSLETHRVETLALGAGGALAWRVRRLVAPEQAAPSRAGAVVALAAVALACAAPATTEADDTEARLAYETVRQRTNAYLALTIDGVAEGDRIVEDRGLSDRLDAKAAALEEVSDAVNAVLAEGDPDWAAAALAQLGTAHEDMAVRLITSQRPTYLTERQLEIYDSVLFDKAAQRWSAAHLAYSASLSMPSSSHPWRRWTSRRAKLAGSLAEDLEKPWLTGGSFVDVMVERALFERRCPGMQHERLRRTPVEPEELATQLALVRTLPCLPEDP